MIPLDMLDSLPVYYRVTVGSEHLDAMGHLNVRWYVGFFDESTWAFMAHFGVTSNYIHEKQAGMAALEQHIRYFAEVRLGQTLAIKTRLLSRSAKRVHFIHFMVNETTTMLAATTELVAIHMSLTERRSVPFAEELASGLDTILARHQQLGWDAPVCGVMKP